MARMQMCVDDAFVRGSLRWKTTSPLTPIQRSVEIHMKRAIGTVNVIRGMVFMIKEVVSMTTGVVSTTTGVVTMTAEVVSMTIGVVSITTEVVSKTAEVVSMTTGVVTMTAEVRGVIVEDLVDMTGTGVREMTEITMTTDISLAATTEDKMTITEVEVKAGVKVNVSVAPKGISYRVNIRGVLATPKHGPAACYRTGNCRTVDEPVVIMSPTGARIITIGVELGARSRQSHRHPQ